MAHLIVNGVETRIPIAEEESLDKLIHYLRSSLITETNWISSIQADGKEIGGQAEGDFSGVKLADVTRLEVLTTHPRELAEETLQMLLEFTSHLEEMALRVAADLTRGQPANDLQKLLDGIQVFTDSLIESKRAMKVGLFPKTDLLETDLLSLLKDTVTHLEKADVQYVAQLIGIDLVDNLRAWKETGLPALIRSRDS